MIINDKLQKNLLDLNQNIEFDNLLGWDVDNKFIKPIADALIISKVIQDDNITKMSYHVTGEFSENPHTEIYVFESKKIDEFLSLYTS